MEEIKEFVLMMLSNLNINKKKDLSIELYVGCQRIGKCFCSYNLQSILRRLFNGFWYDLAISWPQKLQKWAISMAIYIIRKKLKKLNSLTLTHYVVRIRAGSYYYIVNYLFQQSIQPSLNKVCYEGRFMVDFLAEKL
jgi:hypothetical protein